jgi:LPXTG-motif cell wall-anchored protein
MLKKILTSGCVLAVLSWSAVGVAEAQVRGDKAVYFTFSQPVSLPQVTLPAGKYLFRLADSLTNRTIVQIYEADGSKLHAMIMTVHAQRPDVPDDPEIRFLEGPANEPPAIATYWYPGERTGWEFIYPREQATRLAQASKQPVLTTSSDADTAEEMRTAELARVSPTGQQTTVSGEAAATTVAGRAQPGEIADDAPAATTASGAAARPAPAATAQTSAAARSAASGATAAQAQDDGAQARRTTLPATASSTPAVASTGALALLAAFGLMLWRRSRVV